MSRYTQLGLVLLMAALLPGPPAAAARAGSLEDRVEHLERLVESRSLVDLVLRLQEMQRELQRLRGQVEELGHELAQAQRRERERYEELERRLLRAEGAPSQPGREPPIGPAVPPIGSTLPPLPGAASGAELAAQPSAPPAPTAEDSPQAAYEAALALLQQRRYDEAAAAFRAFVDRHGDTEYASNAWYWLGEAHYVQRNLPDALAAFRQLPERYRDSPKVPDALLKIGTILEEQGQSEDARTTLRAVIDRYPKSSAAYLAERRLREMSAAPR